MLRTLRVYRSLHLRNAFHRCDNQFGFGMSTKLSAPRLDVQRLFWRQSGNNEEEPIGDDGIDSDGAISNRSKEKSIISQEGDNSPMLNPLLILPNAKKPVFPGFIFTLSLRDEETIDALLRNNETSGGYVGVFYRKDQANIVEPPAGTVFKDQSNIITSVDQICRVGTFAKIQSATRLDSTLNCVLIGHRRITLDHITTFGPPAFGQVTHWRKPILSTHSTSLKAYMNELISSLRELFKLSPLLQEQLHQTVSKIDLNDPYKMADFASAITTADGAELQKVLESSDVQERLALALELLAKDKEMARVQQEIIKQVEEKVSKQQREYFLREQLKNIKKELGMEKDDKEDVVGKFRTKWEEFVEKKVGEVTLKLIDDEIKKLESLEKNSSEFNVTRSYLEWLVAIPWGTFTEDVLNIPAAKAALDADHYGMEEIKTRILEFIAVGKLRGTVAGKIICLVGPPGVGKTSIAKSIAKALNKKFYRFSVGGLTDTAEIKGHRRTYVGAMPGKPLQSLKSVACLNPVILIDEIDKLGRSYNGDPASALLELLDPNQNSSFVDHYLDTPVDFSGVLFVCTANDESTIPGPLIDRMEVIRLSGYDLQEKVAIAERYLVPKVFADSGIALPSKEKDGEAQEVPLAVGIDQAALQLLVRNYSRESGVRSLEKMIEKIARKIAFQKANEIDTTKENEGAETSVSADAGKYLVTVNNLEKFAGKPIFQQDSMYEVEESKADGQDDSVKKPKHLPVGVVMGLAWNPYGGSSIFIETACIPVSYAERGNDSVNVITGQLGSVMKESVNIAYTFAKQFVSSIDHESKFFNSHQLHLHVPEGAVSKDGPSAGIAMTSSLISIALNKPVKPMVAMTGEISLTGKVLPVGGIKEKTLAAKRAGATTIILPFANKRDFDELPDYVKEGLQVHFLSEYRQVYDVLFKYDE